MNKVWEFLTFRTEHDEVVYYFPAIPALQYVPFIVGVLCLAGLVWFVINQWRKGS